MDRQPVGEVDGVHRIDRKRFHLPVAVDIAANDVALDEVVDLVVAEQNVAVLIGDAVARAQPAAARSYAIRRPVLGQVVSPIGDLQVGIFSADNQIVHHAAGAELTDHVELIDEILDFLVALMRAQRDRGEGICVRIIGAAAQAG